jgi:hypothetical protein
MPRSLPSWRDFLRARAGRAGVAHSVDNDIGGPLMKRPWNGFAIGSASSASPQGIFVAFALHMFVRIATVQAIRRIRQTHAAVVARPAYMSTS